ncbi:hypothetical protein [Clostridium cochlearium]|uniref:hypothetical protein n=1 Tax=Clostridium cochlearium TaxID=1494 RepID=UPI00241DF175|nr:hypothetical protein [Clostridium cochlearium]MBE6065447.1 hypothetical protein [Clostridium cochlearium]
MAKTDIPSKRLLQLRPEDWIKAVLGTVEDVKFREIKPEKNPKVESRLDALYLIEDEDTRFILNLEPQGYIDPAIPARMLRYRADVYESMLSTNRDLLPMKQVVIYFSKEQETTDNKIIDDLFDNSNIHYKYDVLRAWEMDKKFVLENELIGLYALLPLMEDERKKINKEIVLKESVKIASEVKDEALSKDILAAMSFLSEVEYSKEIITSIIRREMLMGSPLYEEWAMEERKEAELKTKKSILKEKLIKLLSAKFGIIDDETVKKIESIDSDSILNQLFDNSLTISSKDEFLELLEKALK